MLSPTDTQGAIRSLIASEHDPTDTTTALGSLTPREIEVLRLLGQALTNAEIAQALVVAPGTAKIHVHRVFTKLGVRNRTEAALIARAMSDSLQVFGDDTGATLS
jgi:DNA-binding NarL/FixJ family response regulator